MNMKEYCNTMYDVPFYLKTHTVITNHINDIRSHSKCNLSYRLCVCFKKLQHIIVSFCIRHAVLFVKLKNNKIIFSFSQTQQYILFYFCLDMLRSINHHLAIITKLRIRCVQWKWHSCNMGSHKTYKYIKIYEKVVEVANNMHWLYHSFILYTGFYM
jgi:hypothetical protein